MHLKQKLTVQLYVYLFALISNTCSKRDTKQEIKVEEMTFVNCILNFIYKVEQLLSFITCVSNDHCE